MVWITLRDLIGGHQKGGKFGKQVIKKIVLELLRTKCNKNFMYSVSEKVLDNLENIFDQ